MKYTGSDLKLIAIVTMLIDHIGITLLGKAYLLSNSDSMLMLYKSFRFIGRIAFPIFCFLLVEGFFHTHNKQKYFLRLFGFACISEVPFDLALYQEVISFQSQNVLFTLCLGLLAIYKLEYFKGNIIKQLMSIIIFAALAHAFKTDYEAFGIVFICILYIFHDQKRKRTLFGTLACIWEISAPLAFIFINRYNFQRGYRCKYVFYIFYPAHLLILYSLSCLL